MKGCPECEGRKIIDPAFLEEAKKSFADLTADIIVFCSKNKIDYRELSSLPKVATCIRILESL